MAIHEPPFHEFLGIVVESAEGGEAVARLDLEPHHLNARGVAHGGVPSALLDTVLGAAVISAIPAEWWCATVSLSVSFLGGARPGRLRATGRVVRRGRRVAFAEGEARDERGRVVATAQGSWNLWPYHPERERPAAEPFVVLRPTGERLRVGKILAAGGTYPPGLDEPVFFLKPTSSLLFDGGEIRAPADAGRLDPEVELVAVIGATCRNVSAEAALDHVAGFAVGLDMTLRDLYDEAKARGAPRTFAKGFDTSAPVSAVIPREEIGDGTDLTLLLNVNGERRLEGTTASMRYGVAELIARASRAMTLEPGDLLFTGAPGDAGAVEPGDTLEASLEGFVSLRVRVARSEG